MARSQKGKTEEKPKKKKRKSISDLVKKSAERPKKREKKEKRTTGIPTCSTLMNLACTDNPNEGFLLGRMVNVIGDSSAGKSIFVLGTLAEVAQLAAYNEYRLIYDDAEEADEFDKSKLFGKKMASRLEPPSRDKKGNAKFSNTIQDFQCNVMDRIDDGIPFIYVLDSFDSLTADEDLAKTEQMREAKAREAKAKGSYGMAKPKLASGLFAQVCGAMNRGESILIIISQTRDNIDPMSFSKKTRSGGKALKFYASHEIWLAMAGKIVSRERVIGNKVKFKITKNKRTGKQREGFFSIFYDYGVDDTRSCLEWLEKEKYWKKEKNTIIAKDLGVKGTLQKLIDQVEEKNLEGDLREIVGNVWNDIEDSLKLGRKSRYK